MHQSTGDNMPRALSVVSLGKGLLLRIEVLVTVAAACTLVIAVTQDDSINLPLQGPIAWIAVGVILFSLYLTCRSVRVYLSRDGVRIASLEREAKRSGASMVANTLEDRIGNKLAVTVGYSELLLDDPRLPEDVQAHAERIFNSSLAAAETMQEALRVSRLDADPDQTLTA